MNKSRDGSKLTLGMIKGKPINTSVPSIAIRFNANAEEIEELYQSEDEPVEKISNDRNKSSGIPDPESSPLRYLPRLGKRCTSIDAALPSQDSSPPSDRWKFFTEIKGKITKSVEEIKQRNLEADSLKKPKNTKDKDTSSLSDSDDLSESSISKTCGVISTTEGVEMSTDDETPSLENDKKPNEILHNGTKHHRYRIMRKKKTAKEGKIGTENLAELFEITTGSKPNILLKNSRMTHENVEVESGIEAFEDLNPQVPDTTSAENNTDNPNRPMPTTTVKEMLNNIVDHIENVEIDNDNVINVLPVSGSDITQWHFKENSKRIFLDPEGFVDLRPVQSDTSWYGTLYSFSYFVPLFGIFAFYFFLTIPSYIYGFVTGILCTIIVKSIYNNYFELSTERTNLSEAFITSDSMEKTIFEIPAIKEYHPITKVEGWMNEYPDVYDPQTYHISQTQSVYIRLQGNFLRISHTKGKIPKRALWNEPKHKHISFTGHRIYSLIGARICLLPEGLNRRRFWSKKYPICIRLNKDSLKFNSMESYDLENQKGKTKENEADKNQNQKQSPAMKKKVVMQTQIFSKLTEEEENLDNDSETGSKPSSSSIEISPDTSVTTAAHIDEDNEEYEEEDIFKEALLGDEDQDDEYSLCDWTTFLPDDSSSKTNIYLFGRTDREKEDWFRRLINASHKGVAAVGDITSEKLSQQSVTDPVTVTSQWNEQEYLKYMNKYQKLTIESKLNEQIEAVPSVSWINALISRVLFDCTRDPTFTNKVQERIQRKLSSIKLPYFIEQLSVGELSLGSNPPLIHKIGQPVLDQRGLWVDLGIRYEGSVVLKLQTKLNLMKLKQLPNSDNISEESSFAKWQQSDVDDTAESSSDGEQFVIPTGKVQDSSANLSAPAGGTSNSSKKLMKMVDKIAESKFFQAATENRYIKKAMEGVSNTDLCLKVELKGLVGTLVINMPPPPSDRMWIGFRPLPELWLTAQPIVGERNISFIKHLTNWIEKKLSQEFQKVLVIPNMEDIVIPVMSSQLPI